VGIAQEVGTQEALMSHLVAEGMSPGSPEGAVLGVLLMLQSNVGRQLD